MWLGRADTMAAMNSFLITVDGSEHEVSTGTVRRLLDTSARFWLDLAGLDKTMADGLLRDTFGFHPLAVQDAEHFGQRPKIDAYDHFTLMVVYGATGSRHSTSSHRHGQPNPSRVAEMTRKITYITCMCGSPGRSPGRP